jgi:hypothetical protein
MRKRERILNNLKEQLLSPQPPMRLQWCFDDMLKKQNWEIVCNINVEDFEMPYLWTQDAYDNSYIASPHPMGLPTYYYRKLREMNKIQ